jgi:hypothetical protein
METDMTFVGNHAIKINRARKLSPWGDYDATFGAMIDAIPASTIAALPAAEIAKLVDAMVGLTSRTKAIAERDAIANGFVWDARENRSREIA